MNILNIGISFLVNPSSNPSILISRYSLEQLQLTDDVKLRLIGVVLMSNEICASIELEGRASYYGNPLLSEVKQEIEAEAVQLNGFELTQSSESGKSFEDRCQKWTASESVIVLGNGFPSSSRAPAGGSIVNFQAGIVFRVAIQQFILMWILNVTCQLYRTPEE